MKKLLGMGIFRYGCVIVEPVVPPGFEALRRAVRSFRRT
jgi:hypothetical protein